MNYNIHHILKRPLVGNTWGGFALMIFLDKLADLECTGPVFDQNLRLLVMPIGTLIGYGWKGAFQAAGLTIVQQIHVFSAPLEQLILAVLLLIVIMPAWRMYILPQVLYEYLKKQKVKQLMDAEGQVLEVMLDEEADRCLETLEEVIKQLPSCHTAHHKAMVLELQRLLQISQNVIGDIEKTLGCQACQACGEICME